MFIEIVVSIQLTRDEIAIIMIRLYNNIVPLSTSVEIYQRATFKIYQA